MNNKILNYIDDLSSSYSESINLTDGLTFSQRDTIKTIDFYSNNHYLTGNKDELGREKPFYNIGSFRVTVAKVATDIDVKDIRFEAEPDGDFENTAVATMLINHELFKYLKEINFSKTLNIFGKTRPKYGGAILKKYNNGNGIEIEVVSWKNVETNPNDIAEGIIIETHYKYPDEVLQMDEWDTEDFIKAHAKANKNKPTQCEIKEVSGIFSESFYPENEVTKENDIKFKRMCFYIGVVGKKKFLLYYRYEKENRYKYCPWEEIDGRSLGRGIVEEGFEAQTWTNDVMISMKNAMQLSGKVVLATNSKKIAGNAITDVDNGHIFELEDGKTLTSLNLLPSAFPQFNNLIELWNNQYDRISSTYNANTGEAPTAGTPYSQTALLNQVANSPFEFQREVAGIFLNEVLNDWILPEVKRRIRKNHYLVSEFSEEELKVIDKAIITKNWNKYVKDFVLNTDPLSTPMPTLEKETMVNMVLERLNNLGSKREIEIPEDFLNVEGKITANITGELKNKGVLLQSFDSILRTVVQSYNPQTGKYMVLEDPLLRKIFGQIVEIAGISPAFLRGQSSTPTGTAPVAPTSPTSISSMPTMPEATPQTAKV
jgi:hypothetical protein